MGHIGAAIRRIRQHRAWIEEAEAAGDQSLVEYHQTELRREVEVLKRISDTEIYEALFGEIHAAN